MTDGATNVFFVLHTIPFSPQTSVGLLLVFFCVTNIKTVDPFQRTHLQWDCASWRWGTGGGCRRCPQTQRLQQADKSQRGRKRDRPTHGVIKLWCKLSCLRVECCVHLWWWWCMLRENPYFMVKYTTVTLNNGTALKLNCVINPP